MALRRPARLTIGGIGATILVLLVWVTRAPDPLAVSGSGEEFRCPSVPAPDPHYVIVSFDRTPTPKEREAIESTGAVLLDSLPGEGYLASIPSDTCEAVVRHLRDGEPPANRIRLAPGPDEDSSRGVKPAPRDIPDYATDGDDYLLYVRFYRNVPVARQRQILVALGVPGVGGMTPLDDEWRIRIHRGRYDDLRRQRLVQWIRPIDAPPADDTDQARGMIGMPVYLAGVGSGSVIGQWEVCHPAVDPTPHPDYAGRAFIGLASAKCGVPENRHATLVAGILIGDGTQSHMDGGPDRYWRGIANGAAVLSYSVDDTIPLSREYFDAAAGNVTISSNSWGPEKDDYYFEDIGLVYENMSERFDRISSGRDSSGRAAGPGRRMLIVASSGNEGEKADWSTARVRNSAKNVLTVGNVASGPGAHAKHIAFDSGRGPTRDGRIKPDLVAPGAEVKVNGGDAGIHSTVYPVLTGEPWYDSDWGTSFSTPMVSGAAAILSTDILRSACARPPRPAELRALLLHTADDLMDASEVAHPTAPPQGGGAGDGPDDLVGPDYAFGYGLLRVDRAQQFVEDAHFLTDQIVRGHVEYRIRVTAEDLEDGENLRVTLVWDDPPYSLSASPHPLTGLLQNDLDLTLIDPSGRHHYPWQLDPATPAEPATRPSRSRFWLDRYSYADHRNTVEQVVAHVRPSHLNRTWKLRVRARAVRLPPQEYALVSAAIDPVTACAGIPKRVVERPVRLPGTLLYWALFWVAVLILAMLLIRMARHMYAAWAPVVGPAMAIVRIFLMVLLVASVTVQVLSLLGVMAPQAP